MVRASRSRAGFTLIEILIALVIVVIGLIGVLALLTTSLRAAGEVVEESFAGTTARSVYEAVREGARKRGFIVKDGTNFVRGFVFVHDGVREDVSNPSSSFIPPSLPNSLTDSGALTALRGSDFTIFLPTPATTGTSGAPGPEPTFVYPRPTTAAAENNYPGTDDFLDPATAAPADTLDYLGQTSIRHRIRRVYRLRDHVVQGNQGSATKGPELFDSADQYSYAIAIRRASSPHLLETNADGSVRVNADGSVTPLAWAPSSGPVSVNTVFPPRTGGPKDGLYQVEIMVFRNFEPTPSSRYHQPVPGGRYVGLVAIGP